MALKKECPSCAMEIGFEEKICPVCGYEFPVVNKGYVIVAILLIVVIVLYFII